MSKSLIPKILVLKNICSEKGISSRGCQYRILTHKTKGYCTHNTHFLSFLGNTKYDIIRTKAALKDSVRQRCKKSKVFLATWGLDPKLSGKTQKSDMKIVPSRPQTWKKFQPFRGHDMLIIEISANRFLKIFTSI